MASRRFRVPRCSSSYPSRGPRSRDTAHRRARGAPGIGVGRLYGPGHPSDGPRRARAHRAGDGGRPGALVLTGISDGHREAIEPVLAGHGLAVLIEGPDGTLEAVGAPDVAAALLEELVARRVAARSPGGTLTLT